MPFWKNRLFNIFFAANHMFCCLCVFQFGWVRSEVSFRKGNRTVMSESWFICYLKLIFVRYITKHSVYCSSHQVTRLLCRNKWHRQNGDMKIWLSYLLPIMSSFIGFFVPGVIMHPIIQGIQCLDQTNRYHHFYQEHLEQQILYSLKMKKNLFYDLQRIIVLLNLSEYVPNNMQGCLRVDLLF